MLMDLVPAWLQMSGSSALPNAINSPVKLRVSVRCRRPTVEFQVQRSLQRGGRSMKRFALLTCIPAVLILAAGCSNDRTRSGSGSYGDQRAPGGTTGRAQTG